jgi:hypothetical protein
MFQIKDRTIDKVQNCGRYILYVHMSLVVAADRYSFSRTELFIIGERAIGTHWISKLVPRAALDAERKEHLLPRLGIPQKYPVQFLTLWNQKRYYIQGNKILFPLK